MCGSVVSLLLIYVSAFYPVAMSSRFKDKFLDRYSKYDMFWRFMQTNFGFRSLKMTKFRFTQTYIRTGFAIWPNSALSIYWVWNFREELSIFCFLLFSYRSRYFFRYFFCVSLPGTYYTCFGNGKITRALPWQDKLIDSLFVILAVAMLWENLFMQYANNTGDDQPAHLRSLISACVVRCLDTCSRVVDSRGYGYRTWSMVSCFSSLERIWNCFNYKDFYTWYCWTKLILSLSVAEGRWTMFEKYRNKFATWTRQHGYGQGIAGLMCFAVTAWVPPQCCCTNIPPWNSLL